MNKNIIDISRRSEKHIPEFLFGFEKVSLFQIKDDTVAKDDVYLAPSSDIDSIAKNFYNLDFLTAKFHELREKEIDGHITDVEKILLYDIIEKRILEFPNPYLPKDHEQAMKARSRYLLLKKKFKKQSRK